MEPDQTKRAIRSPLLKTAGFFSLKPYRFKKLFKKMSPNTLKALYQFIRYNPLSLRREPIYA